MAHGVLRRLSQDDGPGRKTCHRSQVVGDQDDCGPGLVKVLHVPGQPGLFPLVDPCGGFVHDQQVSPGDQGAGDHHTALLTSGQVLEAVLAARLESHPLQGTGDGRTLLTRQWAPPLLRVGQGAADRFLDAHGDRVSRYKVLRDIGHPLPLPELRGRGVEKPRSSFIGLDEAQQAADQCRLAGAVRPHESHELTGRDVDRDVAQDRLAEVDPQSGGADDTHEQVWPAITVCRLARMASR